MPGFRRLGSRGTILPVAVLLLSMVTALGIGLLGSSLNENIVTANDLNSQRALAVAEAGLAHARRVVADAITTTTLSARLASATTGAPEVALTGFTDVEGLGAGNGRYSVRISNNLTAYNKAPGYPAEASASTDGDLRVWLRSAGTYRNATRTVRALVSFVSLLNPPGAITLIDGASATELTADFVGNSFLITGNDNAPPSTSGLEGCPGAGGAKPGISVNSSDSLAAVAGGIAANQEDNVTGDGATASQGSYANNGTISAETLQSVANQLLPGATPIPGGSSSASYGTPESPGIFKATASVKLLGEGHGYGILIVTADFEMAGNYTWEGLIIVVGAGSASLTGADSKLYGSMLVANTQGGSTSLRVAGNGGVYFSSQAICRVRNGLPSSLVIAWQQLQ
jgi:hypothetical protein